MVHYIETINPYTEKLIKQYPLFTDSVVLDCIEKGYQAFHLWRKQTFETRAQLVRNLAVLLRSRIDALATLMATEMGKPIIHGRLEIEKCAWCCEHFAEHAASYLQAESIKTDVQKTTVFYEPLGLIFLIMPWNYPFWQVFRSAIPAIMAGNTILLKHAPISTGTGRMIVSLFKEAGFDEGLFQQVIIDNEQAATVIADPKVVGLSFTGSEQTGRILGALAGKHLKKAVLELGGSDPYLIFDDAPLDEAAQSIVAARLMNAGQVCIAPKRVIVIDRMQKALEEKILHYMGLYRMANPLDETTRFGPMARLDLRTHLHEQVEKSIAKGARLVAGGAIPKQPGFFYPPTLLTNVQPGMPAFDEELFGPVIALIASKNEEESIRLANTTPYGLGAAIYTKDIDKGEKIARTSIEAGSCFVNMPVSSDPRVPFGGIKRSGLGRELGRMGILEFVNIKTVSIL